MVSIMIELCDVKTLPEINTQFLISLVLIVGSILILEISHPTIDSNFIGHATKYSVVDLNLIRSNEISPSV